MTAAEWAARYIERGRKIGELPIFGSDEWTALPDDDPRKVASCVRAAELWRLDGEPDVIAQRLHDELADADLYVRYRLSEGSRDVAAGWVELSDETRSGEPFAVVKARRAEFLGVPVEEYGVRDG